jgi:3-oxoacyl-[acyl-carrier protein] reductase
MDLGLLNKVAIVTGSSKGIGKAIALAFAKEGCRVVLNARNAQELELTAEELRCTKAQVLAIPADLTKAEDAKRLVDETVAHFQTVHILVNNVGGIGSFSPFESLSDDDWQAVWELNVMSAVRVTRAVLPYMQRQQWGRIINIASESGIQPDPLMPHYNASKAALINLTKSLSKAYGTYGILVNTVSPAFIRTPLVVDMLRKLAQQQGITEEEAEKRFLKENRPHIVLGRAGTVDETAAVVLFLASEAASFITGSNYRVDGGSVASI